MKVSLKKFKVSTKKEAMSPIEQLLMFVAESFGGVPDGKHINVSAVCLGPKDQKKLEVVTKKWIKKKKPYLTKFAIDQAYGWLNLDIGPKELKTVEEDGYAYIEPPLFLER